jgi:ADP-heptose:LPS heptosyltransferase
MHVAAAAGAPTLGLFGPSDETRYAPWGPRGRTVRGSRPFEHFVEVDPKLNQAIGHMIDLSAARVLAAAEALIAQTASEAVDA